MLSVVIAAVLCDFVFDEYDGKDSNPFRDKRVRARHRRMNGSMGRSTKGQTSMRRNRLVVRDL